MPLKTYSIAKIEEKLREESDLQKRRQLKLILDEMAEVYPDRTEIPDKPEDLYISPKEWKTKKVNNKLVMGVLGESFTGKTFTTLTSSHLTEKHIRHDFSRLPKDKLEGFIDYVKTYIPFTPVWVIGTEESTLECLKSEDNKEYFEHSNIHYVEILEKGTSGTSLLDHMKTYKNFLIALYALSNITRGTIIIDSMSTILSAQHEIVRRIIMGVPELKKEQGILPRHWFWRNAEQEGIMFFGRVIKCNFIYTAKVLQQNRAGGETVEKIRYHEETNKHLSSIILRNKKMDKKATFTSQIEKCRPNIKLYNKVYKNLTLPKFMYNLYINQK